ncbi:MAG: hypothetical protein ACFFCQ_03145 [Promethearchaeota archaeon]
MANKLFPSRMYLNTFALLKIALVIVLLVGSLPFRGTQQNRRYVTEKQQIYASISEVCITMIDDTKNKKVGSLNPSDMTPDIVRKLYWESEMTFSEIADLFPNFKNRKDVSKFFRTHKIPKRTPSQIVELTNKRRFKQPEFTSLNEKKEFIEHLKKLYWDDELTIAEIFRKYPEKFRNPDQCQRFLHKNGIPLRSRKEAATLSARHRFPQPEFSSPEEKKEFVELMRKHYWDDEMTLSQIYEKFKHKFARKRTVLTFFVNNNIPRRNNSESTKIAARTAKKPKKNLFPAGMTPKIMRKHIEVDKWSLNRIDKHYGKYQKWSARLIRIWREEGIADIQPLSISEAVKHCERTWKTTNDIPLTKLASMLITGSMIGDGYLSHKNKKSSYYSIKQSKTSKVNDGNKRGYLELIQRILKDSGLKSTIKLRKHIETRPKFLPKGVKSKIRESYFLRTISTIQLMECRKEWYPGGKKRIPRNLVFSPEIAYFMYCEDGDLHRKKATRFPFEGIHLSLLDFPRKDINFLIEKLKEALGIGGGISVYKTGRVCINRITAIKFLEYIYKSGLPTPPCDGMSYKFPF